jgi:hypothetical protein
MLPLFRRLDIGERPRANRAEAAIKKEIWSKQLRRMIRERPVETTEGSRKSLKRNSADSFDSLLVEAA